MNKMKFALLTIAQKLIDVIWGLVAVAVILIIYLYGLNGCSEGFMSNTIFCTK